MSAVLFHDVFDQAALTWKVTNGTGAIARTTTAAEFSSGGGAMKLTTSTVAAEACEVHRYAGRVRNAPLIVFGGRFAAMDENISNFAFYLGWRDGTSWYRSKLLHGFSANTWQYDAGGSGSADLQTVLTRDTSEVTTRANWHTFLMGADFESNVHLGTVIDEYDASATVAGTALRSSADAASPFLLDFAIETTNLGGTPSAGNLIFDELWAVALSRDNPAFTGSALDYAEQFLIESGQ